MATLESAKKGQVVTLKSGKKIVADGEGGGRKLRAGESVGEDGMFVPAPVVPKQTGVRQPAQSQGVPPRLVQPAPTGQEAPKIQPAAPRPTTGEILSERQKLLEKLKRQMKGK